MKKIIISLFLFILGFTLISCGENVDLSSIKFDDQAVIANGNEQSVLIDGELPEGCIVEYTNNKGTIAGDYYATATIKKGNKVLKELYATLSIDNPTNEEFEKYLNEFFVTYFEGDQLASNIFFEHPENYGLEHYDADFYTYSEFTDEDLKEAKDSFNDLLAKHQEFDRNLLSDKQKISYDTIDSFISYYQQYYDIENVIYLENRYIDQYGGYVADFIQYIGSYNIRNKQDLDDVLSYLDSSQLAFESYVDYAKDKAMLGLGFSDFTLDSMVEYLNDILDSKDDYYLVQVLSEKINELSFLSNEEKSSYAKLVEEKIEASFMTGVLNLKNGLLECKGSITEEGYWAISSSGKELYELELKDLLGISNLSFEEYIKEIDDELDKSIELESKAIQKLVFGYGVKYYSDIYDLLEKNPLVDGTPVEMIEYLKVFAKTIVPDLNTTPEIIIKEMDEASAKVSNAVAYYTKSALDNTSAEKITLNQLRLDDKNDTLSTLAHEGYPGHLYAYLYSKQAGLSNFMIVHSNTAHAEGWATYVSLSLFKYLKENADTQLKKALASYLYATEYSSFLLETRIDVGIHYQGWKISDVKSYLDNLGYNGEAAQEIYRLIIEQPTVYAAYGYGKYYFVHLHDKAQKILGEHYNEIEFNAMLLSNGWTSLDLLQQTYDRYMAKTCHKYGIKY